MVHEIQAKRASGERVSMSDVVRWVTQNIYHDLMLVLFTSRSFKASTYFEAYLFKTYMSLWTVVLSLILLACCFPFSFLLPVVFSTPFVDDPHSYTIHFSNLVWKFRIVSVLFMVTPLQLGVCLLLHHQPLVTAANIELWDRVYVNCFMRPHVHELDKKRQRLPDDVETEGVFESNHIRDVIKLFENSKYRTSHEGFLGL